MRGRSSFVVAAAATVAAAVVFVAATILWPVHRDVGVVSFTLDGNRVDAHTASASCSFPNASPPDGLFRDRTDDRCTHVTEGRLAVGGATLVVLAITTLVLLALAKRGRPIVLDTPSESRSTVVLRTLAAIGGRVLLIAGLISATFGFASLIFSTSRAANVDADLPSFLRSGPDAQVLTSFEIVGRPLVSADTYPWRHELFVVVRALAPGTTGGPSDPLGAVVSHVEAANGAPRPVTEQYDDGWVDQRGTAGSGLVEIGSVTRFVATGAPGLSDLEDAADLLSKRVDVMDRSLYVIRVLPDPRLKNDGL